MKTVILDKIDNQILGELQSNARIAFAELARRVSLSTPSVIERIKKMEDTGVIVGYHAEVCCDKVGLPMKAFVKVSVGGDKLARFGVTVRKVSEVLECHRVTGTESYILQVAVQDAAHLERVIDSFMPYVSTNTSIVLASPISWSPVVPHISQP